MSPDGLYPILASLNDPDNKLTNYEVLYNNGVLDVVQPASLQALVFYKDANNNGLIDPGEGGIAGVPIRLQGTNDLGQIIDVTTVTDIDGYVRFDWLRHGAYRLVETQHPTGYNQGINTVGTAGGQFGADEFFAINLGRGAQGMNYHFGERPTSVGNPLSHGMTAGIDFWNNNNGQALIKALNGGPNATQLGNWLASMFPNLYGANAGASNLAGKTNAEVAATYQQRFMVNGQKLDGQVMATALAVYVTTESLAGNVATVYGFRVTQAGTGTTTINVQDCGAAAGVADNTMLSIFDILRAADQQPTGGVLYNGNTALWNKANTLFSRINLLGSI